MSSTSLLVTAGRWGSTLSTYSTVMSTSSRAGGGGWTQGCEGVALSTAEGAHCDCGQFTLSPRAVITLRDQPHGDVRRVVMSGFKLKHAGEAMKKIVWV